MAIFVTVLVTWILAKNGPLRILILVEAVDISHSSQISADHIKATTKDTQ